MMRIRREVNRATRSASTLLAFVLAGATASCGTLEMRDLKDSFGKKSSVDEGNDGDMVEIRIGMSPSPDLASSLTFDGDDAYDAFNATSVNSQKFYYKVTGCKSGYAINSPVLVNSFQGTVKLYKFDKDCVVGLVSFDYENNTYVPQTGSEFSGTENSTALFKNQADSTDVLKVKVLKQLPAGSSAGTGVVDGSAANFSFMKATAGGSANLVRYSSGVGLSVVGVESPNISAIDLEISDIDSSGKAVYAAQMTCANTLVSSGGGVSYVCPHTSGAGDEQKISDMKIKIITRSPTNKTTYTISELDTELSSGATAITGSSKDGNSTFSIDQLMGAGVFTSNKNLLVIISYIEPSTTSLGTSYIYFTADYGTPDESPN
jgi:hypothetical protein